MRTTSIFPSSIGGFYSWVGHFSPTLAGRYAEFGLTQEQANALIELYEGYRSKYKVSENPDTRTRPAIAARDEAADRLKAEVRRFVSIIDGQGRRDRRDAAFDRTAGPRRDPHAGCPSGRRADGRGGPGRPPHSPAAAAAS